MLGDDNLVDKILERPAAALIVKRVQKKLYLEQQKRQKFYKWLGDNESAEFINGQIVRQSPVTKAHIDSSSRLSQLLDTFAEENQIGWVSMGRTMTQFTRNDYEPDICFFNKEKAKQFTDKQLLFPVPDFVVEVLSKSSKANIERDTVTKYNDYEEHGVPEYWIIDPHEKNVSQYVLRGGKYELILKSAEGVIRSQVVRGFNISVTSIFDSAENRRVLRLILQNDLPK
ncbi:MAG: Uma2 family endonuclease [Bacteroidota bacterium]